MQLWVIRSFLFETPLIMSGLLLTLLPRVNHGKDLCSKCSRHCLVHNGNGKVESEDPTYAACSHPYLEERVMRVCVCVRLAGKNDSIHLDRWVTVSMHTDMYIYITLYYCSRKRVSERWWHLLSYIFGSTNCCTVARFVLKSENLSRRSLRSKQT